MMFQFQALMSRRFQRGLFDGVSPHRLTVLAPRERHGHDVGAAQVHHGAGASNLPNSAELKHLIGPVASAFTDTTVEVEMGRWEASLPSNRPMSA